MTVVGVTTNHESLPCPFESSEWIPWGRPLYDGLVALSAVARSRTERWHGPSGPVLRPPSPSSPLSSPPLSTSSFEGQPSYQASKNTLGCNPRTTATLCALPLDQDGVSNFVVLFFYH